ncbi:hypothetical protein [Aliiroseovarius sp. 2305UL8-7]|uniref:hypothetical protein n=1 Tax=Aliiroseovarius conchicola TaxID=3121637 RepID=UPI003527828F
MGKKTKITALLAGTTLLATGLVPVIAQEASTGDTTAGGVSMTLGVSSTLRFNDNLSLSDPSPGNTTLWDNTLSFGLLSETGVATFSFDAAGTVRTSNTPGRSTETSFDDPSVALRYQLESVDTLFSAEANYQQVSLRFEDPLLGLDDLIEDGSGPEDPLSLDGVRGRANARLSFETGRTRPLGFGAAVEYEQTRYWDTTNTSLFDDDTTRAEVFTRLQFSPVMEGRVELFWEKYDELDDTAPNGLRSSRETRGATASLSYEIDAITRMNASLGYTEIDRSDAPNQDGITGAVSITRDFPTGSLTAEFSSDINTTGRRDTVEVTGAFDLPNGSLTAGVGATRSNDGDVNFIGNLGYTHEFALGTITATLDRSYSNSDAGIENETTRAALGFDRELTPVSSIGFDLDYAEVTDIAAASTTAVSGLRATYTHELTADWGLSTGYEYRRTETTGETDRHSNELFLTIEREFRIR